MAMGMDFIATGHYAKIEQENGRYVLKTSKGGKKDQTYFLYQLTQHQLAHTLFPISHLTKDEVRSIAQKAELPVAHKSESQEICFIPDNNYARFLKENGVLENPGDVVMDGSVIARHQGIFHYTVGQRRGPWHCLGAPALRYRH